MNGKSVEKSIEKTSKSSSSLITMDEFLDFLKITCQVHETITSKNNNENNTNQIDYNQLANNELVNRLLSEKSNLSAKKDSADENTDKGTACHSVHRRRSSQHETKLSGENSNLDSILTDKLNEVINEGILDSVLPFICAANPTNQSNHICTNKSRTIVLNNQLAINKDSRAISPRQNTNQDSNGGAVRKTTENTNTLRTTQKDKQHIRRKSTQSIGAVSDREVLIHVCDEVKGASRDFSCSQKLLISKMGYFADVTAGQRLEDIDISVHCDLQIFEWLMRWIKKDTLAEEMWPLLDSSNVVPILVSAGFLQMEPLLVDCLAYCHAYLNDVVKASANLSCLNESIISRLAAMFTNLELEMVKDKKERVTPRLWSKMIHSLCEPEPQALRGHYASLCDLFRCNRCYKHINESISSYIHCEPSSMHLNRYGQVVSQHNRDLSWNFNHYLTSLYKELKSWRKVYWRLWGNCHYLYCATCETHFPLHQMNWCLYHPDQPQFLGPSTEGRIAGPAGRYPCCGQQAFRFETLPGPTGCQYREHTIQIFTDRDRAILKLAQIALEGNCLYETVPIKPINSTLTNEFWWNGIMLMSSRDRPGLLPQINVDENRLRDCKKPFKPASISFDSSSETESSDNYKSNRLLKQFSTTSSDGCESDFSSPRPIKIRHRQSHSHKIKPSGRHWSGEISARSNQDNQREFEERAMKQVISLVNKRTGNDNYAKQQSYLNGGTYVRLEAEWRERHRQHKPKLSGK